MRYESSLQILRAKLRLWPDATEDDIAQAAMREMTDDGAHVDVSRVHDILDEVRVTWDGYELVHRATGYAPAVIAAYREWDAVEEMRHDGYTVQLDRMSDRRFRVRVKGDGSNIHTTSTSGYPILAAFEKWNAQRKAAAS